MDARAYQPAHRAACLSLAGQRAPTQQAAFAAYLAGTPTHFYVLEHDGVILGCGGLILGAEADELVWGMIDPAWERRGLGRYLLLYRSRQSRAPLLDVTIPAAFRAFYEKAGFRPAEEAGGWLRLRKKMAVCP